MAWQVASAVPDDAPVLSAILSDWIDGTGWMPRLHSHADDLAFVSGLVARGGTICLHDDSGPQGFLARSGDAVMALHVAGGARGRGGGKALLDAAKAGRDALWLWTFEANRDAHRFYLREGFVETARTPGDNDEGLPDIRMVWNRHKETSHA